jgi:diguanylate cyclase (GGDEF)-like protein/PAS domain S-box-containing protein
MAKRPSGTIEPGAAAILEAAPDPIVIVDQDGTIAIVNDQTERVFGYGRGELIGLPVEVLIPEPLRGRHIRHRLGYAEAPRTRRMGTGLDLQGRRKDGTVFPAEVSLSPVRVAGRAMIVSIIRDVTERKQMEERLRFLSSHDVMTGLHNRAFFDQQLPVLEHRRRSPLGIVVLDIDGLKQVNDAEGHAAGDELLRRMGAVLRAAFRVGDVVARIGGDEFAVLLSNTREAQLRAILRRLQRVLDEHNAAAGGRPLRFAFGSATARKGDALAAVLRAADLQMYERKQLARRGAAAVPRRSCRKRG